jgi:Holliday junction resolvase RusA-like endonuclease
MTAVTRFMDFVHGMDEPAFRAQFIVDGAPKAQPRVKAFARKIGASYVARVFTPGTAEEWKSLVATAAKSETPPQPLEGPVSVQIDFYMPRPKSLYRKSDPESIVWCGSKPDADNLAKAVIDAMTQLGWWRDDAAIARLLVTKSYTAKHGTPGARVKVEALFS